MKKILIFLFVIGTLLSFQYYLTTTGFCFDEMKYLSEQEIIDQYRLYEPWRHKSPEELRKMDQTFANMDVTDKAKKNLNNRDKYKDCCKLKGEYYWEDPGGAYPYPQL